MRTWPLSISVLCCLGGAWFSGTGTAMADPIYDCQRTATAFGPSGFDNVVVTSSGAVACVVYDDSTLTLGGRLSAAAPLPDHNITSTTYDSAGRLLSDTGASSTTLTYDSSGRLATDTTGSFTEHYTYDSLGRLTSESGPAAITQTVYDAAGRLTSLTDFNGTTLFQYDALGRLKEADTGPSKATFTYDALDRLMTETTPLGHVITFTYDALGRVSVADDSVTGKVQFFYDAGTGLLSEVMFGGQFPTTYTYDANGLLFTSSDLSDGTSLMYTAPIPEPSSLVILGSALLGIGAVRRRALSARRGASWPTQHHPRHVVGKIFK